MASCIGNRRVWPLQLWLLYCCYLLFIARLPCRGVAMVRRPPNATSLLWTNKFNAHNWVYVHCLCEKRAPRLCGFFPAEQGQSPVLPPAAPLYMVCRADGARRVFMATQPIMQLIQVLRPEVPERDARPNRPDRRQSLRISSGHLLPDAHSPTHCIRRTLVSDYAAGRA